MIKERNDRGLVSIIIPIYNVEKYLRRCLDSVISQDYTNWEVLAINDGSTDSSPEICEEYAAKDSRIRVFHQSNTGVSIARNAALDHVKGDYIAFVDSDDSIRKDYLSSMLYLLEKHNADIVQCTSFEIYDNEIGNSIIDGTEPAIVKEYTGTEFLNDFYNKELKCDNVVPWNKLSKKKLWDDIKLPEHTLHDDEYISPHLLKKADKVVTTSQKLYNYTVREGSIMHTFNRDYQIRKLFDYIQIVEDRFNSFNSKKYGKFISQTYPRKARAIRKMYCLAKKLDNKGERDKHLKFIKDDLNKNLKFYITSRYTKTDLIIKVIIMYILLSFKKL